MNTIVQASTVTDKSRQLVTAATPENAQYLTFLLGGEMFAVGILHVKEIIEFGNLTEIPMMPTFIRGVINLRGAVVPVIDLTARFAGQPSQPGKRTCIVIVEVQDGDLSHDVGIMVDAVSEVLEIPADEIEPPPSFGARIRADFIQGMGKVAGRFVILLNIDRVLSVDEIATLATVASTGDGLAHRPGS
ncbi:chemotaxis protein CheW [Azoarcus sp. KH32C]|uniref:chemotaxis protein CheW n=1 Tax=Azoarcus sp. KH32C TaxID=748247 RepID=UPI0002386BC6|nr:positive regulator of CheA protein activity [Azoarcus sp. KH32C]